MKKILTGLLVAGTALMTGSSRAQDPGYPAPGMYGPQMSPYGADPGMSPYAMGGPQGMPGMGMPGMGMGGPGMSPYGMGGPGMPPLGGPSLPGNERYGALPGVKRLFHAYSAPKAGKGGKDGDCADCAKPKHSSIHQWCKDFLNGHPCGTRQYQPEQAQQGTLVFPNHPFVRSPRDYFMYGQEK